ncbi:CGNR zinc finger domain-containing protein [uncultured Microbacterium sp.]|uniref:CGNR zinc finger domain-containing protein n=1 Tax=uncultured Microbacterium sp. TaxID=191216 RepID=UPI0035CBF32D
MVFIHDTRVSLQAAAQLVNTLPGFGDADRLQTLTDLDEYLDENRYSGIVVRDESQLASLRSIRPRLRELWEVDRDNAVDLVNALLHDGRALPRLVRHDDLDWHIHATADDAALSTRILVETAMAFVDVIRSDEYDRVRICSADDCDSVYIDYSKNGSKRYCDTGNCGNRMNVIAYRQRKARETA